MIRIIKEKTPFILIGFSFIFTLCSYFNWYFDFFKYLGDIVGYSIYTNLFMYYYYMGKRFCSATKIAVLGLFALNISNIIYNLFGINGGIYDIIILIIVVLILIFLKMKKNDTTNKRSSRLT